VHAHPLLIPVIFARLFAPVCYHHRFGARYVVFTYQLLVIVYYTLISLVYFVIDVFISLSLSRVSLVELSVSITLVLSGNDEASRITISTMTTAHTCTLGSSSTPNHIYPYHPFLPVIFVTPVSLERAGTMHSVMLKTSMARFHVSWSNSKTNCLLVRPSSYSC